MKTKFVGCLTKERYKVSFVSTWAQAVECPDQRPVAATVKSSGFLGTQKEILNNTLSAAAPLGSVDHGENPAAASIPLVVAVAPSKVKSQTHAANWNPRIRPT
jgi:succinylarginine dihydrolase